MHVTGPHWGGTGTLDKLAGSHTRLAIYLTLTIHYQKGCDPCFAQYQVQGGEGSGLPSCHQINEVTITQSPPNRSGHILIDKQITLCILVMLPT